MGWAKGVAAVLCVAGVALSAYALNVEMKSEAAKQLGEEYEVSLRVRNVCVCVCGAQNPPAFLGDMEWWQGLAGRVRGGRSLVWSRALLCHSGWTCGVEPTLSMFRGHCFHLLLRDGRIAPTHMPRATPPHFVSREPCGPHSQRCTDKAMDCRRAQNHAAYVGAVT